MIDNFYIPNKIIIEGTNNAGKTSIINNLLSELRVYNTIHCGPAVGSNKDEQFKNEMTDIIDFCKNTLSFRNTNKLIFDRSPFGGTFYFGEKYRKYSVEQLLQVSPLIKRLHPKENGNFIYVVIKRDIEKLKQFQDEYLKFKDIESEKNYYDIALVDFLKNQLNVPVIEYNLDEMLEPHQNAQRILEFIKQYGMTR